MKRFFINFLGTVAGIWFSVILIVIGTVGMIVSIIGIGATKTVNVGEHSVLHLDLSRPIVEHQQHVDIISRLRDGNTATMVLSDIIEAIDRAADDDRIDGVFLDCNGASAGLVQRKAIIDALNRLRKTGKWVYSYGNVYTQGDYFIAAAAADSIFVNPIGIIDIHGLSAQTIYLKGLLDKLGVEMQVARVGTYKSAVEPFIMTSPSEASVEQQQLFLDNIWKTVSGIIAKGRKVGADTVNTWADTNVSVADARFYVKNHLADAALYRRQFIDRLEKLTGRDELATVSPENYLLASTPAPKGNATIAILYATGDIVDNGNGGIVATKMVPQILELADNDDIDALILRINSGGGSAFASEQIWEALGQFKAKTGKPFYVSMSDMAASGGYYIACGADRIYAEPMTLTGSIGIFGLIPNVHGLFSEKLGLTTHTVSTNPAGATPDILNPMTPVQRAAIQTYVNRGYELFVKRVADGRKMTVEQVKAIAEGRVWDGSEALKHHLVDKLGSLDDALSDIAKELKVETYTVVRYPNVKDDWMSMLLDMSRDLEASTLARSLGEDMHYFEILTQLRHLAPVQARMETIELR